MKKWKTVPICDVHWREQEPNREPVRLINMEGEPCFICGTMSDIFVRREVEVQYDAAAMRRQILCYRFDVRCTHACFESLLDVYEERIRAEFADTEVRGIVKE